MKPAVFSALCLAWLADMVALAVIGPLGRHVAASMALYGGGFVLLLTLCRLFPDRLTTAPAFGLILVLGLAARTAFLFFFPPNTDIYRYIWEGAVQNHGFNPYLSAPDDLELAFLAQGDLSGIWQEINHKSLSAVYPPAVLQFFRLLAWVSPSPFFFKAVLVLFDLGVMAILAVLLRKRRLPIARLLFYAANPLVVVFISGEGHLDVLQVFFLCLGLLLLLNQRGVGGYFFLGLAALCKYLSAVVAPIALSRRARWKLLALFLPMALFLPYLAAGSSLFAALVEFATRMHYNDAVTAGMGLLFGPWSLPAAGLLFFIGLGWIWLTEDDLLRAAYFALGGLLVMLPTLHPWYLLMIVPWMCVFPSRAWLFLQASMLFTFPVLGHEFRTGAFQEIAWLKWPEYLPFFGLLAWGLIRRSRLVPTSTYRRPESISVIIPTLNEAENLTRGLADLRHRPWIREIIVADGGSDDDTVSVAHACGVRVIRGGMGRGLQIRAAAEAATGDVLLILHADAALQPGATERIIAALTLDREAAGGCFGMRFRDPGCARRVIAALNNLKALVSGISFGDQAQFVRAEALERIGGFPGLMLMEDVELSLRLKSVGGAVYLGAGVAVSGRRWQALGFLRNLWAVVGLFMRYLFERRIGTTVEQGESYYRKYYQRAS
jgi:rSAM/selenodomain-associated transferase 2